MLRFFRSIFFASFMGLVLFGVPAISHATEVVEPLQNPLQNTVSVDKPVQSISKIAINALFGIAGSVALAMFVWSGFLWLTAGGSSKRVEQGKQIFIWSTLGIVMMFSAYIILNYLFSSLSSGVPSGSNANTPPPANAPATGGGGGGSQNSPTVYTISTPAPNMNPGDQCSAIGGACGDPATCTGAVIAGACSGNASNRCCMPLVDTAQPTLCGQILGLCKPAGYACTGPTVEGLCAGQTNTHCCIDLSGNTPSGPVCGDGTCDSGETTTSCPADCPATPPPQTTGATCGDKICSGSESAYSCPQDCSAP